MKIITKAFIVHSINNIEEFDIELEDSDKYNIVLTKLKLESQYGKIISIFREMKEKEIIKSVYIPKNRKIQEKIDKLVKVKRDIKKSLNRIKELSQ